MHQELSIRSACDNRCPFRLLSRGPVLLGTWRWKYIPTRWKEEWSVRRRLIEAPIGYAGSGWRESDASVLPEEETNLTVSAVRCERRSQNRSVTKLSEKRNSGIWVTLICADSVDRPHPRVPFLTQSNFSVGTTSTFHTQKIVLFC